MPKNKKIKILIAIGIFITLFCVFFLTSRIRSKKIFSSLNPNPIGLAYGVYGEETNKVAKIILEINGTKYESEIVGAISVYELMDKLRNEGKIDFREKNYTGMGKFIETINGVKGKKEQNWIYYVNGKKAEVGVSNYKIKEGDVVSWKYE